MEGEIRMREICKVTAVLVFYVIVFLSPGSKVQAEYGGRQEQAVLQTTECDNAAAQTTASTEQSEHQTTETAVQTQTKEKFPISKKKVEIDQKKRNTHSKSSKGKTAKRRKDSKKKTNKSQIIPKIYHRQNIKMQDQKERIGNFVYFNQADAVWNDNGYQIKSSGCGPTAMALCISSLTKCWVTPVDAAMWAYDHGYYSAEGAAHEMIPALAKRYQLECKGLGRNVSKIRAALKKGHPVVALMGPGYFTKKGHFIVFIEVDEKDQVTVADVGSRKRSRFQYSLRDVTEQTKSASAGGPCWELFRRKKEKKKQQQKEFATKVSSPAFQKMYADIKSVLQKNYPLKIPLKKGSLVYEPQFVTIGSLDINDTVSVMDQRNRLKSDIKLEKVVEEIETKAVKGSFWNTVTILQCQKK